MTEYIEREALVRQIICNMAEFVGAPDEVQRHDEYCNYAINIIEDAPAADIEKMSDGYHTFADLYEQRLILSAALAKNNPHAWKSKRHEDGSVPFGGGWFIMGFDTDEGCYTYHYELKDWDLFQCEELDKGKPWDGHTSKDVRRLLSIPAADVAPVRHGRWILEANKERTNYRWSVTAECSECCDERKEIWGGFFPNVPDCIARDVALVSAKYVKLSNFCPNCGAKMDGGDSNSDMA